MMSAQGQGGERQQQERGQQGQVSDDATMRTVDTIDDDDDDNFSTRTLSYSNMQTLLRNDGPEDEGISGNATNENDDDNPETENGMDDDEGQVDADDDDGDDDDDSNYWMTAFEEEDEELIDPFDVDAYKILHFPGAMDCRGRNIVHILYDRSLFGPRFRRNKIMGAVHPNNHTNIAGGDDTGIRENTISASHGAQEVISSAPTAPLTLIDPLQVHHHEPQVQNQAPPSNYSAPQTPPANYSSDAAAPPPPSWNRNEQTNHYSVAPQTPPAATQASGFGQYSGAAQPYQPTQQLHLQQQHHYKSIINGNEDVDADIHINNTNTNDSNSNKLHRRDNADDFKDVTSEIVAFAEYASATKFKASYLNHLNDGLDAQQRTGADRRSGGANNDEGGIRRRYATRGDGGDHGEEDESRSNGVGGNESRYTQEQLETNRLLQEHLRMYRPPRQQQLHPVSDGGTGASAARGGGASATANGETADDGRVGTSNQSNMNESDRQRMEVTRRMHQLQRQSMRASLHPPRRHGNYHRPPGQQPPYRRPNIDINNNNDAPITPTRAVSTISIAFSPDSRTMASTHGDHTVKISCCHTGKLIRSLEGHPRTPWTVKFHPTNSRIVASGCLGYQVRVWDWNFQKESVRKQRTMDRERRWKGRYDFATRRSQTWGGVDAADEWGNVSGGGGVMGVDSFNNYFGPTSPRGVVEQHPWRSMATAATMREEGDEEKQCMWGFADNSNVQVPAENDDFASCILAGAGIPLDDPAWYDTESDAYNYDTGIGVCLHMIRLHSAVISLSFHPSGEVLAMASGSTLHIWDYNEENRRRERKPKAGAISLHPSMLTSERESESRMLNRSEHNDFPRTQTIDFRHASALRCVHFPPCGKAIIVGGVNPQSANEGLNDPRRATSFYLRLWDFSLDAVLNPTTSSGVEVKSSTKGEVLPRGGRISDDGELTWDYRVLKEVLCNPRTIIPRVLLYNDGGFDISKDGKVLSACAEFWLPDGIGSAMELLDSQQQIEESQQLSREDYDQANNPPLSPVVQRCNSSPPRREQAMSPDPRTPPANYVYPTLEPPSPPGKRNLPTIPRAPPVHNPHPLSIVAACHPAHREGYGRYVPHIAAVSLDTSMPPNGEPLPLNPRIVRTESMRRNPNLGKLLHAAPLDGAKSSGVTCVKLSPSAEYCLLGYGVRENIQSAYEHQERHPVTSLYNVKKGMQHVCTFTCANDDVNISRFHPDSGHGFVYGTKQGRVRVLAKRPWNYYHLEE